MTALNLEHMGEDGPTDVLAFPIDGPDLAAGDRSAPVRTGGPPPVLGDVVSCPTVARRNAAAHDVAEEDELALLVVHGVLHILGHDHAEAEETAVMKGREQLHLARDRAAGSS
jgi:probable rRNA maturation factor